MTRDTIAAISTAWGESGIAIVRISGPEAVKVAASVLKDPEYRTSGTMRLTSLIDDNGNIIDKVLTVYFAGPKSYTGEDIAEIHTHGGTLVARLCLELLVKHGARIAEPGEFTRRAFINGKIDLSQAEGVLGIIKSKSVQALHAAARTLNGELSQIVKKIHDKVLNLQGSIEINLDFPEGESADISSDDLITDLEDIKNELENLEARCSTGLLLNDGVRVVIAGRPNVGKSSLMNALLKKQRAIVTDIPGTTRDIIEESLNINGIPVRLTDTAGLRESENEIELTGIELAKRALHESEICLWVIDSSRELEKEDLIYLSEFKNKEGRSIIVIFNKSDLPCTTQMTDSRLNLNVCKIRASAKTGLGLNDIKNAIADVASYGAALNSGLNASVRQLGLIRECKESITDALDSVSSELGEDITAGSLNSARLSLMEILGLEGFQNANEELLNSIFSRFCVGK